MVEYLASLGGVRLTFCHAVNDRLLDSIEGSGSDPIWYTRWQPVIKFGLARFCREVMKNLIEWIIFRDTWPDILWISNHMSCELEGQVGKAEH